MTIAKDPPIGVAPGPAERDPDLPLVIIDLSGRNRKPPSSLPLPAPPAAGPDPVEPVTAVIPLPLPGLLDESRTEPIGMPASRTTLAGEPATVPLSRSPTAGPVEPLTEILTQAIGPTAATPDPDRGVRGRARVYPRLRRRTATVAGHRRRWRLRGRSLRRWETVVWIAAIGVVAMMVGFVVRSAPQAEPLVAGQAPTGTTVTAPAVAPANLGCFLYGCARAYPPGPPTRVRIPSIKVDSTLESLALNADKVLNPPDRYDEAGWYAGGVVPGNAGPAVIAGHVDSTAGPAVFYNLRNLAPGALVSVERGGTWIDFRVTTVQTFAKDKFPAAMVYQPTPDPELRVITCGGDFDPVHKRYYDDIVVSAILV